MKIQNNVNAFKRNHTENLPKAKEKQQAIKGNKPETEFMLNRDGKEHWTEWVTEDQKESLKSKITAQHGTITGFQKSGNRWRYRYILQADESTTTDTTAAQKKTKSDKLSLDTKDVQAIKFGNRKLNDFIEANEKESVLSKLGESDKIDKENAKNLKNTKISILSQAAQSMLAQANQQNKGVLRYLD